MITCPHCQRTMPERAYLDGYRGWGCTHPRILPGARTAPEWRIRATAHPAPRSAAWVAYPGSDGAR